MEEGDPHTTEELTARARFGGTDRCWPKCAGGHLIRWYSQFERPTHLYGRILHCDICATTLKTDENSNIGMPFINCVRCNYVLCHNCITRYSDVIEYTNDPTDTRITQEGLDAMLHGAPVY